MTDPVFGELVEDVFGPFGGWSGELTMDFGGTARSIALHIQQSDEEGVITQLQIQSYQRFMEEWPSLQPKLIDALIKYYNEEERFAWGPDNEEEFAAWWPEIETREALLQAMSLEAMVIPWDFTMEEVNAAGTSICFSRKHGVEKIRKTMASALAF